MTRPVIITAALTGGADSTGASPHVPVTPAQLCREALAARAAGAAIVHIHVRNPETGKPCRDLALYRETVNRTGRGPVIAGTPSGDPSPGQRKRHAFLIERIRCLLDCQFGRMFRPPLDAEPMRAALMAWSLWRGQQQQMAAIGHSKRYPAQPWHQTSITT